MPDSGAVLGARRQAFNPTVSGFWRVANRDRGSVDSGSGLRPRRRFRLSELTGGLQSGSDQVLPPVGRLRLSKSTGRPETHVDSYSPLARLSSSLCTCLDRERHVDGGLGELLDRNRITASSAARRTGPPPQAAMIGFRIAELAGSGVAANLATSSSSGR